MALTVAELNTRLTADTRNLEAGLRRAEGDVAKFSAGGAAAMKAFGGAVAGVVASEAFRALGDFLADAVKGASDLAESANAVGVAFGQSTPQVTAWAQSLSSAFGATSTEALNAASQFQLVAQEADFTATQITNLAERAFDLGSVFNQSAQDVSTAIKAGLVGEFEPLRRFGVILDQDRLKAVALAEGLIKPKEEMDAGTKQAVIYNEIMRQTAFAQGDAENTAETAAGQMRQLKVDMDEVKTSIGAALLPAFRSVAGFLTSTAIPAFFDLIDVMGQVAAANLNVAEKIAGTLGDALDFVGLDSFADKARGVENTLDDWSETAQTAGDSMRNVTDELVSSNAAGGAFAASQKPVADSIDKVGKSAEEAAKALEKLRDAEISAKDAGYALEDAQLAAAEAQQELNDLVASGGVDMDKVKDATDDLARANESLADANERVTDAQEDFNEALAEAEERHLRDVEKATEDLTKAQEKLADETQDVANAEAKLSKLKAQRQARDQAIANAKAQLAAADTVTERIVAQRALDAALGMEIVTDEELAAAQGDVAKEQGQVKTATEGVERASKDLVAVQAQQPALSDGVMNAADRLKDAQDGAKEATDNAAAAQAALSAAQQPAAGFADDVAEATRGVDRANWDVEKATWAAEKAQRAYNQALIDAPKNTTINVTRNETINTTRNESVKIDFGIIGLPASGSGTVVPLQMRPTLVMHDGGVVPGPRGADVPALLQAGERVIPADEAGMGGGGPIVVQLVADGKVIQEILLAHQRRSGALGFN